MSGLVTTATTLGGLTRPAEGVFLNVPMAMSVGRTSPLRASHTVRVGQARWSAGRTPVRRSGG